FSRECPSLVVVRGRSPNVSYDNVVLATAKCIMKIFDSELFGKIRQPLSFEDIVQISLDPSPDNFFAVRMWRGQGDIDWPLHSTAYRRLCLKNFHVAGGKTPHERDLQNYELRLLRWADHRGFRYHEGRRLPDFELLARMRHHGAATRLVDATRN